MTKENAKAYNYSLVIKHKQKLFIPYLGIELSGWGTLIIMLVGFTIGTLGLGMFLSFILPSDFAYMFAAGISSIVEMFAVFFATEFDKAKGRNRLTSLYFTRVKKYSVIYDAQGNRHFIGKKRQGTIYHCKRGKGNQCVRR